MFTIVKKSGEYVGLNELLAINGDQESFKILEQLEETLIRNEDFKQGLTFSKLMPTLDSLITMYNAENTRLMMLSETGGFKEGLEEFKFILTQFSNRRLNDQQRKLELSNNSSIKSCIKELDQELKGLQVSRKLTYSFQKMKVKAIRSQLLMFIADWKTRHCLVSPIAGFFVSNTYPLPADDGPGTLSIVSKIESIDVRCAASAMTMGLKGKSIIIRSTKYGELMSGNIGSINHKNDVAILKIDVLNYSNINSESLILDTYSNNESIVIEYSDKSFIQRILGKFK